MYEILTLITKYILTFVIYIFIFRVVRMIYMDIKTITVGEDAKALLPHLKLLAHDVVKNTEAVAELYPLVNKSTLIGRSTKCGIVLSDLHVSSEHARIKIQDGHYFIEDLNSANGTYVNQNKLENPLELKSGDHISMAGINMVFSEGGR